MGTSIKPLLGVMRMFLPARKHLMRDRSFAAFSVVVALLGAGPVHAEVRLIATGSIPGDTRDLSGLSAPIGPDQPHDLLGGFGSAIAYTGRGDIYWAATDRGPFDGGAPFRCRVHQFRLVLVPGEGSEVGRLEWNLLKTVLLSDDAGRPLMGGSGYFDAGQPMLGQRFDPEGLRVSRDGHSLYISDEYGPFIDEFSLEGVRVRRLAVPEMFMVMHPANSAADELPPRNTTGRQPNRGLEGLAITPDGGTLWAMPQSPLIQDGAISPTQERTGVNVRTLQLDVKSGRHAEFVFTLDRPSLGISEILAVDDHRFLVLERDGRAGAAAKTKHVVLVDFSGATDVGSLDQLPASGLPAGVTAARKSIFIDLLEKRYGIAGESMPEKIEGLAFGPVLPDGRRTLVVSSDNDLKPDQPTMLWVFAFSDSDLPGLVPQQFGVDPDKAASGQAVTP